MKPAKPHSAKLAVRRETILVLGRRQLASVAGGQSADGHCGASASCPMQPDPGPALG